MFDWAKFRTAKGGIKIHTCWDDTMMIPDVVNITQAKLNDRYGLHNLIFRKGTIIVEDRGYFDFGLMLQRGKAENVFVTRIKNNTLYETVEELDLPEDSDQDILKWVFRSKLDLACQFFPAGRYHWFLYMAPAITVGFPFAVFASLFI